MDEYENAIFKLEQYLISEKVLTVLEIYFYFSVKTQKSNFHL